MANVEVNRLSAEVIANGDPDIQVNRLSAEVIASGDPDIQASRLSVEIVADYVPDEALLYATLDNSNSFGGTLSDSNSSGVHELYLCVLSNTSLKPPQPPRLPTDPPEYPPPVPPGSGPGDGVIPGGPPSTPVDRPPGLSGIAAVVQEQYLMVLWRDKPTSTKRKPKFFTYLIP